MVGVVPGIRDWQAVLRAGFTTKLTKGTKVASEGYDREWPARIAVERRERPATTGYKLSSLRDQAKTEPANQTRYRAWIEHKHKHKH